MKVFLESILRSACFILLSLILCGICFQLAGYSASLMLVSILEGAFFRDGGFTQALRWALPLFITACGVSLAFRSGFFNIGAQGQFYLGAIFATFVATWLDGAPALLLIPASLFAGMAGGAFWSLWPGFLRFRYGADEVITTLMANFMAGLLLIYVTAGPLKDPSGSGQQASSRPLAATYRIATSTGVSIPILLLALLVGISLWFLIHRTGFGLLSNLAGRNPEMLRWQGAKLWKIGIGSFLVSGALAGLAGTIEYLGPNGRISGGFLPVHGFTAILIALVANYSIIGAGFAALFFGGLASAALFLPVMAGLPSAAIDIINAVVALFITARPTLRNHFLAGHGVKK